MCENGDKRIEMEEKYIPSIWCGGVVFKGFKREKKEKNFTNKNSTKQCQMSTTSQINEC